ncbi:MAG: hypothetical protein LUG16_07910 [Candidatus Gastranaerophilales bacterium]|nr:hypothetical protein [Candidatus Gastranaerophilales bacterium]
MSTEINATQLSSGVQYNINNKKAEEDSNLFSDSSKVKSYSTDEQTSILSEYVNDFDSYQQEGDGFVRYNQDGSKDFLRVVNDNGQYKIITNSRDDGSETGNASVFEITKADEFDNFLNGNTVEDFTAIDDLDLSTYSSDMKEFAQEYINKYDTDGDENLNFEEYYAMFKDSESAIDSQYETIISENQKIIDETDDEAIKQEYEAYNEQYRTAAENGKQSIKDLANTLFTDFQMDNDSENISASEFASQFMMADIDWSNTGEDYEMADVIDGKLNFYNYNTVAADPDLETYNNDISVRKDIYNQFYGS